MTSINYPADLLFDIDTLVSEAQPEQILLVGDPDNHYLETNLNNYIEQRKLLQLPCNITHIKADELAELAQINQRYDLSIVVNVLENMSKQHGQQVIARLRDVISTQFCLAVATNTEDKNLSTWTIYDFFSLAMKRVASYPKTANCAYDSTLYKYSITDYKKTPTWLNADNWANPEKWNKYRW